jgi:hypothetical protein
LKQSGRYDDNDFFNWKRSGYRVLAELPSLQIPDAEGIQSRQLHLV